jgi:ubiquinone biosynthesis protein
MPLSELLRLIRGGRIEAIDKLGFDRRKLAKNLLYTVLEQIFRFQFFHADTHPGNVLAMSDNSVGFIDFGLADSLDPNFRKVMMRLLAAIYSDDFETMFQSLVEVLIPGEDSDLADFRADFFEQSRRWQRERDTEERGVPRTNSPVARYMVGVLRAARRNHFKIPTAILSMYRALLTAEIVAGQLGGDVDLAAVGRQIFERIQIESLFAMIRVENWQPAMTDWLSLLKDGPRQTQQVIHELLEGQLVLKVHTSESDGDQRLKNLRARLISLSIMSVAIVTLLSTTGRVLVAGPVQLSHLLWGSLLIVAFLIVLTWRRLS